MKCVACGKLLTRFAVSVDTSDGPKGWGPKCARKAFKAARRQARIADAQRRQAPDPRQGDLFGAAA